MKRLDPSLRLAAERHRRQWWWPWREHRLDVIAELTDAAARVDGLAIGRQIGNIITGSVLPRDVQRVRSHPSILTLKLARRIHPLLERSVSAVRATPAQIGDANRPTGRGTVIGIIDDGCDFAHRNFHHTDGRSRILYLWDQAAGQSMPQSPPDFAYGTEYTQAALTSALAQHDPYTHLRYQPKPHAHGTHVMDIAAGNGRSTGIPGVAPEADLIFVHLGTPDYQGRASLGNSRRLLEAIEYIFTRAGDRPTVINISIATNGGPHDGTTPVERAIDTLLATPGRAVVIAAGNTGDAGMHASGAIPAGSTRSLTWQMHNADTSDNELEIWYTGDLHVTLRSPTGHTTEAVAPGSSAELRVKHKRAARVESVRDDPVNRDHQISIFLHRSAPRGAWTVTLDASTDSKFHAWIERDDYQNKYQQSIFAPEDQDATCTLSTIACAHSAITVAGYDHARPTIRLAPFSSRGPTRTGGHKPDVSAPSVMVRAAAARAGGSITLSGTSQAAPHVTGAVALLLQAALPRRLTTQQIKAALASAAHWQPEDGCGRLDVLAALRAIEKSCGHGTCS